MAWTAQDCALLLQAMAGYDPHDPASVDRPVADMCGELDAGLRGLRVGVVRHFFETDAAVSDETQSALATAIEVLRNGGALVRDVTLPSLAEWSACAMLINLSESFDVHAERLRTRLADYGERLRNRLVLGAAVSGPDYVRALRRRRELGEALGAAMCEVDVLVYPTVTEEAPPIEGDPAPLLSTKPNLAHPANVSGYPVIAVCTGFSERGLPLSMQLVGKPFTEPTLFRAAHAYEQATEWRARRPQLGEASIR
jgi:aspartyl-tRNA(Asn)/glutamyl-tRNA(Gln) amidotransferase subunit A